MKPRVAMIVSPGVAFSEDWVRAALEGADVVRVDVCRRPPRGRDSAAPRHWVRSVRLRPTRLAAMLARRLTLSHLVRSFDEAQRRHGRFDLLHSHTYARSTMVPALSKALDVPYVLTEHSSRLTGQSVEVLDAFEVAHRRVETLRLDFIGDGSLRDRLGVLARQRGLGGAVGILGPLPRTEVARRLRHAGGLGIGSQVETFCVAAVEALASGTPVIAPAVGALPEIVDSGSGVLVRPGDTGALADGIVAVATDAVRLRPEAMAEVAARFSYERIGEQPQHIYSRALTTS